MKYAARSTPRRLCPAAGLGRATIELGGAVVNKKKQWTFLIYLTAEVYN